MMKRLVLTTVLTALLAACGGGDSGDGGNGGSSGAGTGAMAAAFETELTKIKECVQGQVDGKGDCTIDFLTDPVTKMCAEVRIGTAGAFPNADKTQFTTTCDDWKAFLTLAPAEKVTTLDKMLASVEPLK